MTKYLYCAFNLLYFLCMFTLLLLSPLVSPVSLPPFVSSIHSRGDTRGRKVGSGILEREGTNETRWQRYIFLTAKLLSGVYPLEMKEMIQFLHISAFGKGSIYGWIMIIRWKDVLTTKLWCQPKIQPRSPSPLSSHPLSWGNDVAKYFNDLELVIKRSLFGFWSLVDIRGHS